MSVRTALRPKKTGRVVVAGAWRVVDTAEKAMGKVLAGPSATSGMILNVAGQDTAAPTAMLAIEAPQGLFAGSVTLSGRVTLTPARATGPALVRLRVMGMVVAVRAVLVLLVAVI